MVRTRRAFIRLRCILLTEKRNCQSERRAPRQSGGLEIIQVKHVKTFQVKHDFFFWETRNLFWEISGLGPDKRNCCIIRFPGNSREFPRKLFFFFGFWEKFHRRIFPQGATASQAWGATRNHGDHFDENCSEAADKRPEVDLGGNSLKDRVCVPPFSEVAFVSFNWVGWGIARTRVDSGFRCLGPRVMGAALYA